MEELVTKQVPEVARRLGRHVAHDPRSRMFPALRASENATVEHKTYGLPLDQGNLGSCTGNAMAGLLMTDPFYKTDRILTEADAVALYERATVIDPFPGAYPPEDTGSAGLYVAKAAVEKGWCQSYGHAFGLQHALEALTVAPVIIGINWYDSFFYPRDDGRIRITSGAQIAGGHEVLLFANDAHKRVVTGMNSWGPSWGVGGTFTMSYRTLGRLLDEQGDVTTITA